MVHGGGSGGGKGARKATLKEQAAAHRATKGSPRERAIKLEAKADRSWRRAGSYETRDHLGRRRSREVAEQKSITRTKIHFMTQPYSSRGPGRFVANPAGVRQDKYGAY
jgi:hypothetical protein